MFFSFIDFIAWNTTENDDEGWRKQVFRQTSTALNVNLEKIEVNKSVFMVFVLFL